MLNERSAYVKEQATMIRVASLLKRCVVGG